MQRLSLFTTRQGHIYRLATATQEAVVGHSQIQAQQLHNRLHKSLGRAQRQMINLLQSSHAQESRIAVVAGFAALPALFVVVPGSEQVITNPESKTSALNQCGVILFPIAKAVSALGFLFLHKLRLPALPPSCLCNKALRIYRNYIRLSGINM
jgi:hypothetical protein